MTTCLLLATVDPIVVSQLQAWTGIIAAVVGFLVLLVSNILLMGRFISKMTNRFDINEQATKSLGQRVDRFAASVEKDMAELSSRLEAAASEMVKYSVDLARLRGAADVYFDADRLKVIVEGCVREAMEKERRGDNGKQEGGQ